MAKALKQLYNQTFFNSFLSHWKNVQEEVDETLFLKEVYVDAWPQMELKERINHLTKCMHSQLPKDYKQAVKVLEMLSETAYKDGEERIEYYFIPTYIELYGLHDFEYSMRGIEKITQYYSCEFAIRPFLSAFPNKTMKQMQAWSTHAHHKVRRLASEGCRPKLPWAKQLDLPTTSTVPILSQLKSDQSLYVKKSVANHLNDLSKKEPVLFKQILQQWKGTDEHCDWILKHASRTFLKAGDPEVMATFGFNQKKDIEIDRVNLEKDNIKLGESLSFSFTIKNNGKKNHPLRIEYAIHYLKSNGTHSQKVFKISEKEIKANSSIDVAKKHSLKKLSTRKYYDGSHSIQLIINGRRLNKLNFTLKSKE